MKLTDLELDMNVFVNHPKCTGKFVDGESGCLFTAFFRALGCTVERSRPGALFYSPDNELINMRGHLRIAAEELNVTDFNADSIMVNYDNGHSDLALNKLWELIDKWPNKKGFAKIEDVKMPTCGVK